MPTKLDLDEDDNLVLVQQDGTTKKISFQRFVYNVSSTATIAMKLDGTTISANVVDGSITADKLEPTLQKTLRQYMLDAQTAAQEAEAYNKSSISYAVGGTGSRIGEDTDNSKYYSEKAKEEAEKAGSYANLIFPEFYLDASTGHLMCKQGKTVTVKVENDHVLVEVA